MKILKKIMIFIFMIGCLFTNMLTSKAQNNYVKMSSLEELSQKVASTINEINTLSSSESPTDHLNYFTDNRQGWKPLIKYIGNDKNQISYYVFCLSHHKLGPKSPISYNREDLSTIPEEWYAYAYIIENGFNGDFSDAETGYSSLKWSYYVTSMAIWQYQYEKNLMDDSAKADFVSIRDFSTNDTTTKDAIIALVDGALNNQDKTKFIIPYNPTDGAYQIITPNVIYQIEEQKYYCQYIDGVYYDNDGNKVNYDSYLSSCQTTLYVPSTPEKHYCEIVNGVYYDKNGNGVLESIYNKSCNPLSPENKEVIEKTVNNPKTGVISYLFIIFLLVISLTLYKYSQKKKKFIKIK